MEDDGQYTRGPRHSNGSDLSNRKLDRTDFHPDGDEGEGYFLRIPSPESTHDPPPVL